MMPSSSANVEAPPTAGVQLTEGALAGEVPAGVHLGALSSNARASAGDMNTASAGDTNGTAAIDTNTAAARDTNGAAYALCELLAVKLGTGGGPCWPPAMALSVVPSCCCTCSWTSSGIRATCALSASTSRVWLSKLLFFSFRPPAV